MLSNIKTAICWVISHFSWESLSRRMCLAFCWHSSVTKPSCKQLSHLFFMVLHYLSVDWWSLLPNKQLPHYPSELHPPPPFPSLPLQPTTHSPPPSIHPFLIQSSVDSFHVGCSSATASIIHLLSVQLLDLVLGGKPGFNWSIAGFYVYLLSAFNVGKRSLHGPFRHNPGSFRSIICIPDVQTKDIIF